MTFIIKPTSDFTDSAGRPSPPSTSMRKIFEAHVKKLLKQDPSADLDVLFECPDDDRLLLGDLADLTKIYNEEAAVRNGFLPRYEIEELFMNNHPRAEAALESKMAFVESIFTRFEVADENINHRRIKTHKLPAPVEDCLERSYIDPRMRRDHMYPQR